MSDGAKGRKFGRSKRGGSMATYNAVRRDVRNKEKSVARHEKGVTAAQDKAQAITPHGAARKSRRADITKFKLARAEAKLEARSIS